MTNSNNILILSVDNNFNHVNVANLNKRIRAWVNDKVHVIIMEKYNTYTHHLI